MLVRATVAILAFNIFALADTAEACGCWPACKQWRLPCIQRQCCQQRCNQCQSCGNGDMDSCECGATALSGAGTSDDPAILSLQKQVRDLELRVKGSNGLEQKVRELESKLQNLQKSNTSSTNAS
jgi:hypothetical protein